MVHKKKINKMRLVLYGLYVIEFVYMIALPQLFVLYVWINTIINGVLLAYILNEENLKQVIEIKTQFK